MTQNLWNKICAEKLTEENDHNIVNSLKPFTQNGLLLVLLLFVSFQNELHELQMWGLLCPTWM